MPDLHAHVLPVLQVLRLKFLKFLRLKFPVGPSAMSAHRKEGAKEVVRVGSVVRRPSAEVVEEMAALARQDKAQMATPIPPMPRPPGRFWISQGPPLPRRPPINPVAPASPERTREIRVAAISGCGHDERETFLLEEAEWLARRPRTPTPPRRADDHYDLARWSRQRWK